MASSVTARVQTGLSLSRSPFRGSPTTDACGLAPVSPRPHSDPQLRTRRTVDSWVWLGATEGGASCRLLGRGARGRRSRSGQTQSTYHTSHPKPRAEERMSRTCWFVARSLTAILTARLPRPVPMLVTSLMKSPLARTLATDSSASGAERGK